MISDRDAGVGAHWEGNEPRIVAVRRETGRFFFGWGGKLLRRRRQGWMRCRLEQALTAEAMRTHSRTRDNKQQQPPLVDAAWMRSSRAARIRSTNEEEKQSIWMRNGRTSRPSACPSTHHCLVAHTHARWAQ